MIPHWDMEVWMEPRLIEIVGWILAGAIGVALITAVFYLA